jgi:hypothetical protein
MNSDEKYSFCICMYILTYQEILSFSIFCIIMRAIKSAALDRSIRKPLFLKMLQRFTYRNQIGEICSKAHECYKYSYLINLYTGT